MRFCKKCQKTKNLNEFPKNRHTCKLCRKLENKEYYKRNKDSLKSKRLENYYSDPEKHKKEMRLNYYKFREERLKKAKEYYLKNKDKIDSYRKDYWNKSKNKKRRSNNKKLRKKLDPSFRIICNIRSRVANSLRTGTKPASTKKSLGCTPNELKLYLESKFKPGMSWDNYGEWHIDHIIPLSSFDLTDESQFKRACHYTNLQPLWAKDNLKKGASIPT